MIPPIDREYSQDSSSDQTHASYHSDDYLNATRSSYSSLSSFGSPSEGPLFAAASAPEPWFDDFILYEPDDDVFQDDSNSVSETSGLFRMDISNDIPMTPLLASSPRSVPAPSDAEVSTDPSSSWWPSLTELDDAGYAVVPIPDISSSQRETTMPTLNLPLRSYSESAPGDCSNQSLPQQLMSTENDAAGRISVTRIRHHQCPTCKSFFRTELRLSQHLRKSHPPARFSCGYCPRAFQHRKDLTRHQIIHEFPQPHACSCGRRYTRYDGLLRHIAKMARRPRETGLHKAGESNSS